MELIETTFESVPEGFHHRVTFEFYERTFVALVVETTNETLIRDCFEVRENLMPIDIQRYFGEFKNDVYTFIYDNIQRGLPVTQAMAPADGFKNVSWFDYVKQESFTEDVTDDHLEWMQKQKHIEIDKIN